jgi:serine/threonine protein kinase
LGPLQVLRGVAYLHDNSIVHRDLTPRNIMVKPSGHTLVIDLGLAVDLAEEDGDAPGKPLGSPVGAVGTLGYIPPESMRNEKVRPAPASSARPRAAPRAIAPSCGARSIARARLPA